MNEDAFARRFYADRAELDSLGIALTVDKPADGAAEQENYSLRPENFHLPDDQVHRRRAGGAADRAVAARRRVRLRRAAAPRAAADLLGPAQPARRPRPALGRAGPHRQRRRARPLPAPGEGRDRDLPPQDDHLRVPHDGARRGRPSARSTPTTLLFQGGQFYLVGKAHERDALRVFRLSRIRGKVAYATKAEHDFQRPGDFDPRAYANRARTGSSATRWAPPRSRSTSRIAWQIERHFGRYGEVTPGEADGSIVFATKYATRALLVAWVLGPRRARAAARPARARARGARPRRPARRAATRGDLALARKRRRELAPPTASPRSPTTSNGKRESGAIRPERFARLVTLASVLIEAGRRGERLRVDDVVRAAADHRAGAARGRQRAQRRQLRRRLLRALRRGASTTGEIEVDPEPYSDNFARPARLLPVEAKALVAAIDLIGDHIPEGSLASAREKIVARARRGPDRARACRSQPAAATTPRSRASSSARHRRAARCSSSTTTRRTRTSSPRAWSSRTRLINGREGWYVAPFDPRTRRRAPLPPGPHQAAPRSQDEHFEPRPEVDPAADVDGWPRTGEVAGVAHARACGSRPSARAGRARSARSWPSSPTARCRRAALRGHGLARARGAQGGRRRGRARARPTRARPCATPRPQAAPRGARSAAAAAWPRGDGEPPRPDHDERRRGRRLPRRGAHGHLRHERPRGWPHLMPLWYVVARRRRCGPGRTPSRRRSATSSATRARRCRSRPARVRRAARRDARDAT